MTLQTETWKLYIFQVLIGAGSGLTYQNAYSVAAAFAGLNKNSAVSLMNVGQIGSVSVALAMLVVVPKHWLPVHERGASIVTAPGLLAANGARWYFLDGCECAQGCAV